jgi:hypothetical protein
VLAMRNPEAARVFAIMVEHGHTPAFDAAQTAAIRADIVDAFRAGFMLMALFTAAGCVLALTNPMRKI